jgi:(R,R)-butanediol dehydrogenase/meso-butanediol dehydrogenase/diacetyl reductase/L-iditol 2-dehydrogenase
VVGAGAIGHLCARILALRGFEVRVFDQTPSRLAYFQSSAIQTSNELTGLEEFDAIVEATGSQQALQLILEKSQPGCVLLLLGFPYASQPFNFETLVGYDKTVIGSVGSAAADFQEAIELLPRLDLTPFLQKTLPLERYQEAWELFHTRQFLKVMMAVNPG